jgi:aminopeptidase N
LCFITYIAFSLTAAAPAHEPAGDNAEPIIGCGKGQALAARWLERSVRGDAVSREAMDDTDVLHYDLDIEISNLSPGTNTCTITGANVITIRSRVPDLTEFTFRLRSQYNVTSALVNGTTPVSVTTLDTVSRRVDLDRAYEIDEVFTLTIAYTGQSVSRGFGSIDVSTQFGTPVVATLSEPYFAYTWWPVKDGPFGEPGDNSDKATIDLTITVPNNYVVPSNGVLLGVDMLSGNRRRYRWSHNYPITMYLVSFAATNYNTWTQLYNHAGGTMPVEFYIYPGNDTSGNRAAWERVLDMLPVFRDIFGEYPFIEEKYGIYNFNFGGGMEHQTITGQGTFAESVTAHELAHQWWGDMITCRTWSDIWLNEGFATYGECLWEERKTGVINPTAYFAAVQARKPSSVGNTVYVPPAQTNDLNRIFSSTFSYQKGCWVLHQLRGVVGDDTFFDILADYRAAFEFSAATTDEFVAVASNTYGSDLSWFFDQWVYQPGAPAYNFGWQSANVAGQNYLLARVAQTQGGGYPNVFIMPVDLRVTIGGSPQTVTVWNDAREQWFVVPISATATALQFDPNQWILRTGASTVTYVPGPPKIVQTDPAPGDEVLDESPISQITVTFHTPVNTAATDFSLVGQNTGPHTFTLAGTSGVNPVVLNLDNPLPPDVYTLSIADSLTAANSSMALDGEIADSTDPASLPSGNGVSGGQAVIQFAVVPSIGPGDIDGDGDVDEIDLQLFVAVLLGLDDNPDRVQRSDIDGNDVVNGDDIQAFVAVYPGF